MLTASHLPWNRNGMKFFTRSGGLGKKDIAALVDGAAAAHDAAQGAQLQMPAGAAPPASADFLPVYAAQLVQLIRAGVAHPTHFDTPLAGFKIVVDAGNGSGGFFASQVLQPLGADTRGSQFLDPDGNFPNHVPNPEEAEAVLSAAAAVRAAGADLGVIFDTDVDRSAIIDRAGAAINRNRLIALLAAVVLRERPGATIVTDSVTSDGLTTFIAAAGGKHYRYRRGYKNVIDKGVELAAAGVDVPLMIETSGHGAMAENHYLDDGAYLAVKVLIEAGRRRLAGQGDVEQLLVRSISRVNPYALRLSAPFRAQSTLREPLEEAEFRLPLLGADFKAEGAEVVDALAAEVRAGGFPRWTGAAENHEGFRACVDEGSGRAGWALLRQSLHDPLLVLNLESEAPGGGAVIGHTVLCWLQVRAGAGVDISALEKAFAPGGMWADYETRDCTLYPSRGGPRLGGGTCGEVGGECEVQW
jgi:phosphomannomutase